VNKQIDYSKYTYDELLVTSKNIDKEAYPERYKEITDLLNSKNKTPNKSNEDTNKRVGAEKYTSPKVSLWSSLFLLGFIVSTLVYEAIPLKTVTIYRSEQPFLYWLLISMIFIGMKILFFTYLKSRKSQRIGEK
jgi:hypothetical protein